MIGNFLACLTFTLAEEGGFTDDLEDNGGPTNRGITLTTLSNYFGRPATISDIRNLTEDTASRIYQADYWRPMNCDALPKGIDLCVFDFGVNTGPRTSIIQLQRCIDVETDGVCGPITVLAAKGAGIAIIDLLAAMHESYYRALDGFARFGSDWLGRVQRCVVAAKAMG